MHDDALIIAGLVIAIVYLAGYLVVLFVASRQGR